MYLSAAILGPTLSPDRDHARVTRQSGAAVHRVWAVGGYQHTTENH